MSERLWRILIWVYYSWDFPCGWDGPYRQKRERGFRLFGHDFIWHYFKESEDVF